MRPSKPAGIIAKALAAAPQVTIIDARDDVAVVESAIDIDQLTRSIIKEHIALQDDERNADAHEKKSAGYRKAAARRRVEIGRMLIEAKRGIKHGGWGPYLEKLGIERQRANEWMRLAGYVEEQAKCPTSTNAGHLNDAPTLAEAGIDKRPRKSAPPKEPEEFHILVESTRARKTVEKIARKWPASSARSLVMLLRDFADDIERGVVQLLDEQIDEEGGAR